jgi:hypothetical protein
MTIQLDTTTRNAILDAIEASIGASPTLKLRTGAQPASTATADSGTVLATLPLPADWMSAAADGAKALLGTWADASADASGTAGHFRVYDSAGTCRMQGSATITGGGGNLTLDNPVLVATQTVTITDFTLTAPHP